MSKYVGQHSWWVFALCCVSVNVNTEYANTEESIINITQNYFHSNYLRLYNPRNSRYHPAPRGYWASVTHNHSGAQRLSAGIKD